MDLLRSLNRRSPIESRTFNAEGYTMQPRINLRRDVIEEQSMSLWRRLVGRDDSKACHATDAGDPCEKPSSGNSTTLPIVLGIAIPVVVAIVVLIYLHRRMVRNVRQEDAKDLNGGLDFGLDIAPTGAKKGRRSILFGGEKGAHRPGQLSMDMNMSSPYLLPPGTHQSQDSIHTLSRTLNNEQDPYRTVMQYSNNSEAGSIRSFNRGPSALGSKRASIITGKSMGTALPPVIPPPRTNSMPKSPATPRSASSSLDEKSDPFATPIAPEPTHQLPGTPQVHDTMLPVQPIVPEIGNVAYPDDKLDGGLDIPDLPSPPAAVSRNPDNGLPSHPDDRTLYELPAIPHDNGIGMAQGNDQFQFLPEQQYNSEGLGLDLDMPRVMSPQTDDHVYHGDHPQIQTSQYYEDYAHDDQANYGQAMDHQQGLGVPQQENKRLSVGFRPLPPDEVTESEDPEYRANRIRSFYKEYFEDTSAAPPMPNQRGGDGQYYEDYDQNYLGDATYYDADSNAFVMPYAQPVTRRAMTPPPAGRNRGPPGRGGPRGPHGPHGSLGGMSLPGGPRRPRAGSAFGPRPDSSASARIRNAPKKRGPPPNVLSTLPTPSKLRDDSFLQTIDFAPPQTMRDQAAGRSQSPLGERRPYQQPRAVASPLVTAFDELSVLPSPHSLRKSTTFTGLDFAPPKKFKDSSDTLSDAGSIRSNRSGISAVQLGALRNGAGRVSRLPGDTVFTQEALAEQLKPQWNSRY